MLPPLCILSIAWLIWVICLNGGTLAFNSAYDCDTNDIAYLHNPPKPPPWLAVFAVCVMLLGTIMALWLEPIFGVITLLCVFLSVLYSHPATRWKAIPGADLLVNMAGYGGGTTLAGLFAGQLACGGTHGLQILFTVPIWFLVIGFALLFGSFYPLSQIYQIDDDQKRGDRTLAVVMGRRPSLRLAMILGWAATISFLIYFLTNNSPTQPELGSIPVSFLIVLPALLVWQIHIFIWWLRAQSLTSQQHEQGMYRALFLWAIIDVTVLAGLYASVLAI